MRNLIETGPLAHMLLCSTSSSFYKLYQSEIVKVLHGSVLSPTLGELHQEMNHIRLLSLHLQPIAMSLVRLKGEDELNSCQTLFNS